MIASRNRIDDQRSTSVAQQVHVARSFDDHAVICDRNTLVFPVDQNRLGLSTLIGVGKQVNSKVGYRLVDDDAETKRIEQPGRILDIRDQLWNTTSPSWNPANPFEGRKPSIRIKVALDVILVKLLAERKH